MFQAHVLNLLIGNKASNVSGKAVKLGGYQWKVDEDNARKWKLWVIFHLKPSNSYFVSMKFYILVLFQLRTVVLAVLMVATLSFLTAYIIAVSGGVQFFTL